MLSVTVKTQRGGELLLDATAKQKGLAFTTGEHGYANCSLYYPCDIDEAFLIYNRPGLPHVQVADNGVTVWEGRIEDVAIIDGGVRLAAFGYQRALSDTLYTASFSAVAGSAIAGSLITSVTGTNSTQLSANTALISSPGTTVTDSYEDARPADILNRLAATGDTSGNLWEWGVYDSQMLYFRQRGSAGRAWYVDAASLELERSLDKLYNSAYGVYTGGTNTKSRTSTSTDTNSVTRYGVTRQAAVGNNYNDTTIAAYARDTFIAQYKVATPRAKVKFGKVFDASGNPWPMYYVRASDTLTIRNLPPTSTASVDSIRTFYIVTTNYNADSDTLDVELSSNTPTIDRQIAQGGGTMTGGTQAPAGNSILTQNPQYSFGTWTPAFVGTTTAGVYTYGNQRGVYMRLGNTVFVIGQMNITAIGTPPVGNMTISGLPFASAATNYFSGINWGTIDNFNYTAAALDLVGRIGTSASVISLFESFDNAATVAVPAANFTNVNCNLTFSAFYQV